MNDPLNYLLSRDELDAALGGMASNLKPGGILIFDVNTLATYRTFFAEQIQINVRGRSLIWSGHCHPEAVEPGIFAEARFEAVGEPDSVHLHHQRHFPRQEVLDAISSAGLTVVEVLGVSEPEGDLSDPLDEDTHSKAVYVSALT